MSKNQMISNRNSNLELLRIFSMFLIVMSHSDEWAGLNPKYATDICVNTLVMNFFNAWGQIGVGGFCLLSGYFLINSTSFSVKKILKICGEVWFYSIFIFLAYLVFTIPMGKFSLGIMNIMGILFPISLGSYWYPTAYVLMLIILPQYNKYLNKLSKPQFEKFIFLYVFIDVILIRSVPFIYEGMIDGRFIPFMLMYTIGAYIKLFVNKATISCKKNFLIAGIVSFLLYSSYNVIQFVGKYLGSQTIISHAYYWRVLNSPLVVIICSEVFLGFLGTKPFYNKLINSVARTTFGIYLIHSHSLISSIVLPAVFPVAKMTENPLAIFGYTLISVIIVFAVSSIVDYLRFLSVEKIWEKLINAYSNKIYDFISRLIKQIRTVNNFVDDKSCI